MAFEFLNIPLYYKSLECKIILWASWGICRPKTEGGMAIRDFENFNLALLAKLASWLTTNSSSVLSTVLLSKYCSQVPFLNCSPKNGDSWIWKGIYFKRYRYFDSGINESYWGRHQGRNYVGARYAGFLEYFFLSL